jgi:hypothetical protein
MGVNFARRITPIPTRRLTALGRASPLAPNAKIRHEAPTASKGIRDMTRLDVDVFAQAGELLVGRDWQRALARILAPYHPSGTKTNSLDDSLVRKWKRGDRPIPEWVQPALAKLLKKRVGELEKMAKKAASLSEKLARD